jgi:hypothetical protein
VSLCGIVSKGSERQKKGKKDLDVASREICASRAGESPRLGARRIDSCVLHTYYPETHEIDRS